MATRGYFAGKLYTAKMLLHYRVELPWMRLLSRVRKMLAAPDKQYDLVIIDDSVPKTRAGFRNYEFSYLLDHVKNSAVYSIIGNNYSRIKALEYFVIQNTAEFEKGRELFCVENKIAADRIHPFYPWTKISAKYAYVVFLANTDYLIDYLEERKIKFIMELYPGGGFGVLTEGPGYEKLKRIMASPYLAKVIVTQKLTKKFLLEQKLCTEDKMAFKYGATLSPDLLNIPAKTQLYGVNKDTIDICFTSAKYMPKGLDKGYDIFIDMACLLLDKSKVYRFHIVGGFNETDIEIPAKYKEYFKFYGFLRAEQFITFYADKDIFVSPSRAFTLGGGFFDGFPTAACSEASLNGLCMVFSDPLDLSIGYTDMEDCFFAENYPDQFAEIIINLTKQPSEIYRIGNNGKIATLTVNEGHGAFRADLVNKLLSGNDQCN